MNPIKSFASHQEKHPLEPFEIQRRNVGPKDVKIQIEYCGVCHTDLHFVNNDWKITEYPVVPGHEIVGRVTDLGSEVNKFSLGDLAAIGCMINSCGNCKSCMEGMEQYCLNGFTATYNSPTQDYGGRTFGGYSQVIVANESFVLHIPDNLEIQGAAPLLCAGITTYSPLKHWNIGPKMKVGIVGLGGLGHMGVKFAHALGAHTVMITTSPHKAEDAKSLGADDVLISSDANAMKKENGEFDFILNTIPVNHSLDKYLDLLKVDATMCIVGAIEPLDSLNAAQLLFGRKNLSGSIIGGIKETQEMLDFCGTKKIISDVEVININQINEAFKRLVKSDVKYRFVINMNSI
ncbi:MAG: hydroxyacid dehydrogenase [Opitutae bacterium]|nr:hydroxyacid dehydrogenase [Opitutae bacterium]|tara:strand:- start:437 stop:1480 length:1044 start_codon:yes stop_codon:yes gene_type:complete